MKVLVIEDDPSLREIICRSLEKEGMLRRKLLIFKQRWKKRPIILTIVFCSTSCYRTETGWICWKN